jgi:tripartite-type tricarboxylate transporter receptor subunit TctC
LKEKEIQMIKYFLVSAWLGVALTTVPATAQQDAATSFPNRAVKIIVSGPPAGGVDIVARILADRLQKQFGQPFVVENRPGASGNLGAETVAMAKPDGHTLLAAQPAALTTNIVLYKKLNFDPAAFEFLAIMTSIPNAIAVRNDLPVNSLRELIAYAKVNPGKLNFGSQGVGTTPHLTTELFARLSGTRLTHIPYRGTAQAVNDLVAAQLDTLFIQLDAVREHYLSGRVKLLAVLTNDRVQSIPEVPTAKEAGMPEFISNTWNALVAPPLTPAPIVAKLNQAVNEVLKAPESVAHFHSLSMEPIGGTPGEVRTFIKNETERWSTVIRAAGIEQQ